MIRPLHLPPGGRLLTVLFLAAVLLASARGAGAKSEPDDAEHAAPTLSAEARGLLKLGNNLTDRGDYTAAEIAYRQILQSSSFNKVEQQEALIGMGRCYRKQGTYTKATAVYEKFLKEFPEDGRVPDVLLDVGRTLRAMGAHKMAIARFYSVLNSTLKLPADTFDHYQLLAKTAQFEIAETHFEAGNYAEAGKFFSRLRLLDLAPADRARAHFKSAYSMQLAGDSEAAVTALRAYLEQWPEDENVPEARFLLATTLRKLGRTDEALTETFALLRGEQHQSNAEPRRWVYWQRRTGNQLANEFFHSGDTANALAIYQGLAALSNDAHWQLPVLYQVALCQEQLRAIDRARETYQNIVTTVAKLPTASAELNELAKMATWRISNMEWHDQADRKLTAAFSTTTGQTPPLPASAPPHDASASPAATPPTL
ncbi:MAG: tetratricopeptide repeat protein [Opitutae bacterium]|nr:tetratricopeptide repeat protein [Opitutae bacterium]